MQQAVILTSQAISVDALVFLNVLNNGANSVILHLRDVTVTVKETEMKYVENLVQLFTQNRAEQGLGALSMIVEGGSVDFGSLGERVHRHRTYRLFLGEGKRRLRQSLSRSHPARVRRSLGFLGEPDFLQGLSQSHEPNSTWLTSSGRESKRMLRTFDAEICVILERGAVGAVFFSYKTPRWSSTRF